MLQDGALEGSNVSPVETMVAMISAARQFEAQMKMLQTAEQNEQAASARCSFRRLARLKLAQHLRQRIALKAQAP